MLVSKKLASIAPSSTLVMTQKARQMREAGVDIISLSSGEPDFDTPDHIKQAAVRAIADGHTKYTNVDGIPALKDAICAKFKRDNNLTYTPEQINVSPGGKAVIYNTLIASLNQGDEVIIPAPCWVSYPEMVRLAGGSPVLVHTSFADSYCLSPYALERAITPRTKWLFLNSPSNPTGQAYNRKQLLALADVLRAHPQVHILSDDIYEHLIYDGRKFATMAEIAPDLYPRTLTMNGVSKAYAMTGWRIGYAGGPPDLIKAMAKIMGQTTSNAASISQWAALAALTGPQDFIASSNAAYTQRRDLVVERLSGIPGLNCPRPDGAFYVFPDCAGLIGKTTAAGTKLLTDIDIANALLTEAHVAVVPGTAFHSSPNIRISYSSSLETLAKACDRIEAFCSKLS